MRKLLAGGLALVSLSVFCIQLVDVYRPKGVRGRLPGETVGYPAPTMGEAAAALSFSRAIGRSGWVLERDRGRLQDAAVQR